MRIRNSTDLPDYLLRRMTAWCCRQLPMPVSQIKLAVFRNSRSLWGGCARSWHGQITVCVGPASGFPHSCSTHEQGESFADRLECLIAVTAHECFHIAADKTDLHRQRTRGYGAGHGSSERVTCAEEMRLLRLFRANRDGLLAEWSVAPVREPKPEVSTQEKRAGKAQADLARWTRKLKLAQTKIRKLKVRVAYYERLKLSAAAPAA